MSSPLPPSGCPMNKDEINPLNNIPNLASTPSPGQTIHLPIHRTISTIPRANSASSSPSACPVASGSGSGSGSTASPPPLGESPKSTPNKVDQWEYPSPQQFYNALVRKGWETPEESVEVMVNIHNWLNEAAWTQVRQWEEKHPGGTDSSLARFQGRPQDLSPKARYHMLLGKLFPSTNGFVKPFDRHDWLVHRPTASSDSTAPSQPFTVHRYVIDYYSLPEDAQGNPVFSLDVRPAVDSLEAVKDRLSFWWKGKKDSWFGGGASVGVTVQEEK